MGKIIRVIGPDAYELIKDRVAAILIDELAVQMQLTYDAHADAEVSIENTNPEDLTSLPTVNVSVAAGTFDNKDYRATKGTYQYFIDCYAHAKTTPDLPGNQLAAQRLHKLMRLCRSILNDPIYKTLGFKPPFIYRVYFTNFDIRNMPGKSDTLNSMMGRLYLTVEANEENTLIQPSLIDGYETKVNIGNSSVGYYWKGNNY